MLNTHKLLITASAAALISGGAQAHPNYERLSADWFKFDGSEFETTTTAVNFPGKPDGALFFRKKVAPQEDSNVLFVSLYATSDQHGGARIWFSCRVNGVPCRSSPPAIDEAPSGWITLQHVPASSATFNCSDGGGGPGDCHDNGIAYQWCVPVPRPAGSVVVDLRMATSNPGTAVFIEKGHVYVDAASIRGEDRCVTAVVSEEEGPLGLVLKDAAAKGEEVARTKKSHE